MIDMSALALILTVVLLDINEIGAPPVTDKSLLCEEKQVLHGKLIPHEDRPSTFMVICNPGFILHGKALTTCLQDGQWSPSGECEGDGHMSNTTMLAIFLPIIAVLLIILMVIMYAIWRKRKIDKRFTEDLKSNTQKQGHMPDRPHDRKINLEKQYVKLRLVDSSKEVYSHQFSKETVPLDQYQNYLEREQGHSLEIDVILEDEEDKGQTYLFYGRAGVGKSTLVQKMTMMWSNGTWAKGIKAVFMINIRHLTVYDKRKVSLYQFLSQYTVHRFPTDSKADFDQWIRDYMKDVLMFVDGLDEYADLAQAVKSFKTLTEKDLAVPHAWCINILRRDILKHSTLILTSRPFNISKSLGVDKMVEVVGLTRDTVMDFVDGNVDKNYRQGVKDILLSQSLLLSVCSITFYCVVICKKLEEDLKDDKTNKDDLSHLTTYTRIMSHVLQLYMKRSMNTAEYDESERSYLLGGQKNYLRALAEVAYTSLMKGPELGEKDSKLVKITFSKQELEAWGMSLWQVDESLDSGLLICTSVLGADTKDEMSYYEFVHLSVQELLSAAFILEKSPHEIEDTFDWIFDKNMHTMAQLYLFGLHYDSDFPQIARVLQEVQKKQYERQQISFNKSLEKVDKESPSARMRVVQLVYESQNEEVASSVLPTIYKEAGTLKLRDKTITAVEMKGILFMVKSSRQVKTLWIERLEMDETSFRTLCEFLETESSVESLILYGISEMVENQDAVKQFARMLEKNTTLKKLELSLITLDENQTIDWANALQRNTALREVSYTMMGDWTKKGFQAFVNVLKDNKTIEHFTVTATGLDDMLAEINEILKKNETVNIWFQGEEPPLVIQEAVDQNDRLHYQPA